MPALLEFRNVSRTFNVRRSWLEATPAKVYAVNDVSLSVLEGETLGLVGESGCGKSTLARMAVSLLPPSAGELFLEGQNLAHLDKKGQASLPERIQMVFQDPFSSLNPRRSVGAAVEEPLMLAARHAGKPMGRHELKRAVEDMLDRVGLAAEHYTRYPHEFSGGQRQRVAVARALITKPRLIVCDEPVSALDASVQAQVLNLFKDIQDEMQVSYLFISHDLGVVGFMGNRIAVMYLGKIVELAPRDALFESPAHPYTRALLAAAPSSNREHTGKLGTAPLGGELPSPLNPPAGCAFHPRCPLVQPVCREMPPPWLEKGPRSVRCHFPLNNW